MKALLIAVIPSLLTAFMTFIVTRRKYLAEVRKENVAVDSNEIDNIEKAARIWRQLSEDVRSRLTADIDQMRSENQRTNLRINALTRENSVLRSQMDALQKELQNAKAENRRLHGEIKRLTERFAEA
ncbi:MAG: hypothetical protein ACM3PR_00285 [Bacteroidales bacterium]